MEWTTRILLYPEGDEVETSAAPPFNELLDLNGQVLPLPLKTEKTLVYRVFSIRKREERGETKIFYLLELVPADELKSYVRASGRGF
ncbi:MAG: hypothetical protein HKM06_00550 [Spirochaetales bacterium]|nr:hypothetical protein [Spirochaetales bacterium]